MTLTRLRRTSLALALAAVGSLVAAIACSGRSEATARVAPEPSATTTTTSDPREPTPPAQLGSAPRVRYDLAAHLARAELRQGDTLVIDFGTPGAAKYTIGGWRTRVGDDLHDSGVTASPITGATGFVLAPSDRDGPLSVELHARAVRDGRATIYVGGHTLGHATLPTDSYASASVVLPADAVHRGENMVQLRVPRTGSVGGVSAGVLIDWMRVGPEGDPHAGVAPPAPSEIAVGEGSARALVIPDGWSLGYAMEVPVGARLHGRLRGTGSIDVVAVRDGAADVAVGTVAASSGGTEVDLSLASVEGSIVRLDLRAHGGTPRFTTPAIITLDGQTPRPRPHVRNAIVYLTDTLRADKLRPYRASSRVRTPRLDAWAHGGALLTRGHSQENWTKPSVATLLSGLYPWEHHATGEDSVVPDGVDLISERLGREGFYTGAFVANGFCSDRFGFRQGWRTFRNYVREGLRNQAEFVAHDVLDWLDHRPTDQPFFLYVHTVDPHVPYMPPAAQLALYDPLPYDGVVDFGRDRELLEHVKAGTLTLNDRDRDHLRALYDGEISYHDTHFGGIIDGLASRGLSDDTMIVFTADHGEEFWDHGSVGHGHSVFEELIHVPLIVRIPGVTDTASDGARVDDVVGLVDVIPTMYETLGRPVPSDLSGRSFLPQLLGEASDVPRAAVTGFMEGWRAINVGRLKLVQRTERTVLLYDTTTDPGETHDLAADHPIAVRYARGLLGLYLAGVEHGGAHHAIAAATTTIDAHTREELEALGYAGASRPAQDDGTGE